MSENEELNFHDLLRSNHLVDHMLKDVLNPKVQVQKGETVVELTYTTSPKFDYNWWININEETYLVNELGFKAEKLKMIRAENIPIAPNRLYLENKGDSHRFRLIFPAIPDSWGDTFHLQEYGTGLDGFFIMDFKRNATGRYFKAIA